MQRKLSSAQLKSFIEIKGNSKNLETNVNPDAAIHEVNMQYHPAKLKGLGLIIKGKYCNVCIIMVCAYQSLLASQFLAI